MFVTVHHHIRDPKQWAESSKHLTATVEQGRLPEGVREVMYLPSADGRQADTLWETDSLEHLKSFLDRETGAAAKSEYIRVNDLAAVGLPYHESPLSDPDRRTEEAILLDE